MPLIVMLSLLMPAFETRAQLDGALPFAHAIAMHDQAKLPADFDRLPYGSLNARKGGRLVLGLQGTFDSLNPYIVKGVAPQFVNGFVVQSLMARSLDEPFTLYAQIASGIAVAPDRKSVTFRLDPRARFSDGAPVTSGDVAFSWAMLRDKGRPNLRTPYRKVAAAATPDQHTIRFEIGDTTDRELPLILGLMPIVSKAATKAERFDETTFEPLVGSGPYVVSDIRPGQSFLLKRNLAYWGAEIATSRGLYNFDEIKIDFYRDANALFEAFKAGLIDYRAESDPTRWTSGYDIPAVRDGRILKEALASATPKGMSGFVFNTRRATFADIRLREALGLLFDFDWINRNLYAGAYTRTASYFEGSELSARDVPASRRERGWLANFPDAVRSDILDGGFKPPRSDGSGRDRDRARAATDALRALGFRRIDDVMRGPDGTALAFEILVLSRPQERLALVYAAALRRIGIDARVRLVDDIQFWKRLQTYDFDMTLFTWASTASPGNEQFGRWGAASAQRQGSLNYAGVQSPAADAMIERMLAAETRAEYVDAVRALDRVLMSGFYVVPLFHLKDQWVARASGLGRPERVPLFGLSPELLWWNR